MDLVLEELPLPILLHPTRSGWLDDLERTGPASTLMSRSTSSSEEDRYKREAKRASSGEAQGAGNITWLRREESRENSRVNTPVPHAGEKSFRLVQEPTIHFHGIRFSSGSKGLIREFSQARAYLDLDSDWDGDGGKPLSVLTWERAGRFASRLFDDYRLEIGKTGPVPELDVTSNGGLDLLWRTKLRELLVHVPSDRDSTFSYYGNDGIRQTDTIGGVVSESVSSLWMLVWLNR